MILIKLRKLVQKDKKMTTKGYTEKSMARFENQ
jgi:hypothetical protein